MEHQDVDSPPFGVEALLGRPVRRPGDKGAEVRQPVYRLDVHLDVRCDVPRGMDVRDHVGFESYPAPVIDVQAVRRRRWNLATIERGIRARNHRPRVRVRGGFAGQVARVKLLECGVDVVAVEYDDGVDPVVGVDRDDAEHLSNDLTGPRATHRGTNANKREVWPAARDDGRRKALKSDLSHRAHVRDMGSTTE